MFNTVMVLVFLVLVAVIMWFPGFILAYNMTIAVSERKPTAGEIVGALIPGINLGVARKQLYGSAKLVWTTLILLALTFVLKMVFFYRFDTPLGILLSLIFTYVFYFMVVVAWLIQGYVLFDMGNLIQCGTLTKLMGFIIPPLASYIIGRNCIPLMRAASQEIANQESDTFYDEE